MIVQMDMMSALLTPSGSGGRAPLKGVRSHPANAYSGAEFRSATGSRRSTRPRRAIRPDNATRKLRNLMVNLQVFANRKNKNNFLPILS
jgi:hypothetical protein